MIKSRYDGWTSQEYPEPMMEPMDEPYMDENPWEEVACLDEYIRKNVEELGIVEYHIEWANDLAVEVYFDNQEDYNLYRTVGSWQDDDQMVRLRMAVYD